MNKPISTWKDKALFTPGPLTTSRTVKQAMLRDMGSRDAQFIETVRSIRRQLLALGKVDEPEYTTVLLQGSGTFGIEAVISSIIPTNGKLLVLINGAYGERINRIAEIHKIATIPMRFPEDSIPKPEILAETLDRDDAITHVAVIHCETTTGVINPIDVYGEIVHRHQSSFIVDAMSSFGAYPIDMKACKIDTLISSSNKNLEGVPGFSFVIARKESLQAAKGQARTLSLDLVDQWEGLEKDGQFRFTPPTHAILAFLQALVELEEEGGILARAARYQKNYELTLNAMQQMGFRPYLKENQGHIITSFHYPDHPNFNFQYFYQRLSDRGFVIYPGKLSHADCFRIGHIGRLDTGDIHALMAAIADVIIEMKVQLP